MSRSVSFKSVLVAAVPYILLGYPWFSMFRDPWFHGGGLTVEQLRDGPGYLPAFSVAIVSAIVTSYVLAFLVIRTGEQTSIRGMKMAALVWLAFIGAVMATQHTFEARSIEYFLITAGYPLVGLLIMGAILGGWRGKPETESSGEQITAKEPANAR